MANLAFFKEILLHGNPVNRVIRSFYIMDTVAVITDWFIGERPGFGFFKQGNGCAMKICNIRIQYIRWQIVFVHDIWIGMASGAEQGRIGSECIRPRVLDIMHSMAAYAGGYILIFLILQGSTMHTRFVNFINCTVTTGTG